MFETDIRHIVVIGNDGAGAAAAAAAAISLQNSSIKVSMLRVPKSDAEAGVEICRGGLAGFHQLLGIDEQNLIRETGAVISLGTRYRGFVDDDRACFVPLGSHGMTLRLVDFHHYAAKLRAENGEDDFNAYSLPAACAAAGRFNPPGDYDDPVMKTVVYDIHIESDGYMQFMLGIAVKLGVAVIDGSVAGANLHADGTIRSLQLANGQCVEGDFFIDCTEDRSAIAHIDGSDEFDDWSEYLPCDRVAATRTETGSTDLFVSIEANETGWTRQTSAGRTTVETRAFSSACGFGSSGSEKSLNVGSYRQHWVRNCVAIGSAATTLEPMEVSTLHLAHNAILRLLAMLPRHKTSEMLAAEFNRVAQAEATGARDYQVLRYALSGRRSGSFWEALEDLRVPGALQERINLFAAHGRFTPWENEFAEKSRWVSSLINFGAWPAAYDPLADMIDEQRMRGDLRRFREAVGARRLSRKA